MDDTDLDQRAPHQRVPNAEVSLEELAKVGVNYWQVFGDTDPQLAKIREEHNFSYHDYITISKDTLPGYDEKLKIFYSEHMHDDDEIRFVLEGAGYFDVRNKNDEWIRVEVVANDMISLPAGIYHRFTLDESNYAKGKILRQGFCFQIQNMWLTLRPLIVMRLFVGDPIWTAHNRKEGTDGRNARADYIAKFYAA
jgi:1,2-dihydroxy-3-keto-5-methylthiopentene dioxygenase